MRGLSIAIAAIGLCLAAPALAQSGDRAGISDLVRVWATRAAPGGSPRGLFVRETLFVGETVATTERGILHVQLLDNTQLRLGENASVTLDDFIYRRDQSIDRMSVTVTRGVARFITGRMHKDGVVVRSPIVAIGVRGTDFSVWVEASGRTTIWVNDGTISVTPVGGVPELVVTNETVVVEPGSADLQRNAVRPAPDPGLRSRTEILFP